MLSSKVVLSVIIVLSVPYYQNGGVTEFYLGAPQLNSTQVNLVQLKKNE